MNGKITYEQSLKLALAVMAFQRYQMHLKYRRIMEGGKIDMVAEQRKFEELGDAIAHAGSDICNTIATPEDRVGDTVFKAFEEAEKGLSQLYEEYQFLLASQAA